MTCESRWADFLGHSHPPLLKGQPGLVSGELTDSLTQGQLVLVLGELIVRKR